MRINILLLWGASVRGPPESFTCKTVVSIACVEAINELTCATAHEARYDQDEFILMNVYTR